MFAQFVGVFALSIAAPESPGDSQRDEAGEGTGPLVACASGPAAQVVPGAGGISTRLGVRMAVPYPNSSSNSPGPEAAPFRLQMVIQRSMGWGSLGGNNNCVLPSSAGHAWPKGRLLFRQHRAGFHPFQEPCNPSSSSPSCLVSTGPRTPASNTCLQLVYKNARGCFARAADVVPGAAEIKL